MAQDINTWTGSGRVGTNPELSKTQKGTSRLRFRLAVSTGWGDNQSTTWLSITMFGKRAEALERHISKGQQIFVTGRLEVREFDRKDGTRGTDVGVVANDLAFGKDGNGGGRRDGYPSGGGGGGDFPADDFGDDDIPFATAADLGARIHDPARKARLP